MRLPGFEYLNPQTLDQALDMLKAHKDDAKILAGGTDLLVRMKKGVCTPKFIITLKNLDSLSYITEESDCIKIGAKTPIANITASKTIEKHARAFFMACKKIGAVTIQHYSGTIGGNILQDNRCHHYNQSNFYRSGRQGCHKDGGKICYAREEADRCNSTCQSDGATALMALDTNLTLEGKGNKREVKLADFYTTDGIAPFAMESHELLTQITIPKQNGQSAYKRLAYRSAIDYPIVSAAVLLESDDSKKITNARIVIGAMGRSPLLLANAASKLIGKNLDDEKAFKDAAASAMDSAATFAVHNIGSTLEYRCSMAEEMVLKALKSC
jgi:4-hydroxybenzoyl-CoA reductase beta subunit